jgi:hypothetical protein
VTSRTCSLRPRWSSVISVRTVFVVAVVVVVVVVVRS